MFRMLSLALLNALLSIISLDVIATNLEASQPKQRSIYATYRRHHYEPMLSFEGGHVHLRNH